jgi:transcription elongation factor GreA
MSEVLYVTEDGLQKLKEELNQLRTVERPMISRLIADARDKGDLSENAEYAAAKEAQGLLEMKISKLDDIIARSRVIDGSKNDTSTVRILNKVKIRNKANNTIMEYQVVPESEANLKIGETVQVKVPSGVISFEIISISM